MSKEPWYKDGLKFECSQCGDCCTGSPGYVWVNKAEIEALAKAVGVSVDQFETLYVQSVGIRKSLRDLPQANYDCVLLDPVTRKCSVYEHRPRQCRTWPFWDSNVKTPEAWAGTCEICPGSGKGRVYQLDEIQERVKQIKI